MSRAAFPLLGFVLGVSCACTVIAAHAEDNKEPQHATQAAEPVQAPAPTPTPTPAPAPANNGPAQAQAAEQPQPSAPQSTETAAAPAQAPRILRNVVVAPFAAPPGSNARAAVLQTLADHNEVEVVAMDDVSFASRRLQADANTPAGRAKLSRELGIDAWLDGKVEDGSAHLTLSSGDGDVIEEVTLEADEPKVLDAMTGERMWAAMGTRLSAQEEYRRALLAEYQRARNKYDARSSEQERLRTLAREGRARRAATLRAQFALAQRKRAAMAAEVTRQSEVARNRAPEPPTGVPADAMAAKTGAGEKAKKAVRAKPQPPSVAKKSRRGVASSTGLTNTGGMHAKKASKKPTKTGKSAAAVGGKAKSGEKELLSRQ